MSEPESSGLSFAEVWPEGVRNMPDEEQSDKGRIADALQRAMGEKRWYSVQVEICETHEMRVKARSPKQARRLAEKRFRERRRRSLTVQSNPLPGEAV